MDKRLLKEPGLDFFLAVQRNRLNPLTISSPYNNTPHAFPAVPSAAEEEPMQVGRTCLSPEERGRGDASIVDKTDTSWCAQYSCPVKGQTYQ
ncbi:hypothetical protein XENOCAPTIV_031026, partial [Xenoophorus captivus]